jgi:hypothetical protein
MDVVVIVVGGAAGEAFAWLLAGLRDGPTSPSACATLQALDDMAMSMWGDGGDDGWGCDALF